jgi:4-amino-4-deoxy-L-arabinose transferase-like glycosyltransferase
MRSIKQNPEITIIFLIGFILRMYYAHLDPYLHEWDERFHALVARNMMDNPLVPMLHKNPIVPYDINSWCCNSVWLHKQPLFMWQMALSMKIFGANEFAMRYPSALMGAITILLVYRITMLFTNNKTTSIIAGLLICFSQYQLEMISGQIGMDHNDMAFCFYILAGFWAFSEKLNNDKIIWNTLIGVFAGCAILNKWLVGLLVYLPFGVYAIQQFIKQKKIAQFKLLLLSFVCCLVIFLPWQVYILYKFNELAIFEYNVNTQHVFQAVHGHKGSILFYFNNFSEYFGQYIWLFIAVGIIVVFIKKHTFHAFLHWSLFISFIVVFIFFSFIAQTKLPTYFFIAAPFGIIYIAIGIQNMLTSIKIKWLNYIIILLAIAFTFNPAKSIARRKQNPAREQLMHNTGIYKNLSKMLPPHVKNVINMNSFEDIDVMFFNNEINANHWWIDVKLLDSLKEKKVWIGAFKNHGDYKLPPEYENYPYLYKIDTLLK